MVRIALVVHKFPPASMGGTEIYTLNLARELSRRGHDVFVFYRHDEPTNRRGDISWKERDGFTACRVSRAFDYASEHALAQFLDTFANPDVEVAFRIFLDKVRPDLVHFQHLMLLSYQLVGLAKQKGLPVLLTLHDYWFICGNSQLIWPDARVCGGRAWGLNCARCALTHVRSPLVQPLRPLVALLLQVRNGLVRQAALRADRLITPSHFAIKEYVKAGFPEDRFTHLENGIDAERIWRYPHRPTLDGCLRFSYLGSLAWQKGVHVLLEAFRGMPPEKALLRIYGDPTVFPEYTRRLRQLADPSNTTFGGRVPNEEVGRILAETDVLVVPSLWYENSPLVIQEAFAAKVPVLASRIGALSEKVQHGVSGLLVEPGDATSLRKAVRSLVEHPARIEGYREHIPHAATIEGHVDKLEWIYNASGN